jgi:hypothetical protein
MSKEASIQSIRSDYGREQTEIMHEYGNSVDEVASKGSEGVAHRDFMSYGQVEAIMIEEKQAEIAEHATQAREALRAAHERYESRLAERAGAVREQLFGGIENTDALTRAALASEEELRELIDMASFTGSKDIARVAFIVSAKRGYGDLVNRYLNEIDGSSATRDLYEEWTQIPSAELLDRQRENLDRLVSVPSRPQLLPRVSVG